MSRSLKRYTKAVWDAAAQRLASLPSREPEQMGLAAGLAELRPMLRAANQRGYDAEQLVRELAKAGIQVGVSSVKGMLRERRRGRQKRRSGPDAPGSLNEVCGESREKDGSDE